METAFRVFVALIALCLFVLGGYLAFQDRTASASVVLGFAILCLVFTFLARFKRFKGFGFEGELWEQKQREAAELIQTMRSYTAGLGRLLITIAARAGRWNGGLSRRELHDAVVNVEGMLRNASIGHSETELAKAEFYRITLIDMAHPIYEAVGKAISKAIENIAKELNKFPQPIKAGDPAHAALMDKQRRAHAEQKKLRQIYKAGPIEKIANRFSDFITTAEFIDESEKVRLRDQFRETFEDLKTFADEHRFRSPARWMAGDIED